jgi:hypothetical protein
MEVENINIMLKKDELTTTRLFEIIIFKRDFHSKTGYSRSDIVKYRNNIRPSKKEKRKPTIDQMERMITAYGGYKIKYHTVWEQIE